MICFQCKKRLPEGAEYCTECGAFQGFDEALLGRARSGDQDALAELYEKTKDNVYYTVRSVIRDEDEVLDLVQDTFVQAFGHLDRLNDAGKFRPWIKTVARNLSINYVNRKKPALFSEMSDDEDYDPNLNLEEERLEKLPDLALDRKETTRLMREILDGLSDDQRLVVGLFYYQDMSIRRIAERLDVSENTVKSRLFQSRRKIEAKVRELEKQGTRLCSMSPIALLLLLYRSQDTISARIPAEELFGEITKELSSGASAAGKAAAARHVAHSTGRSVASTTGSGTAKAAATAAAAAKGASASVAAKVVALVAAAAVVVGGGTAAVHHITHSEPQPAAIEELLTPAQPGAEIPEPPELPALSDPAETPVSPYDRAKEELLNKWRQIEALDSDAYRSGEGWLDLSGAMLENGDLFFPEIRGNDLMALYLYNRDGGPYSDPIRLYYAEYDFDGNGTPEIVIAQGSGQDPEYHYIWAVYAFDGEQMRYLFRDNELAERNNLTGYDPENRTLTVHGSGGASSGRNTTYRFNPDGWTLTVVEDYEFSMLDSPDESFTCYVGDMTLARYKQQLAEARAKWDQLSPDERLNQKSWFEENLHYELISPDREPAAPAQALSAEQALYAAYVRGNADFGDQSAFALYDVNGDGIRELITIRQPKDDYMHVYMEVYTLQNGQVTRAFQSQVYYQAGGPGWTAAMVDVDGQIYLDLHYSQGDGQPTDDHTLLDADFRVAHTIHAQMHYDYDTGVAGDTEITMDGVRVQAGSVGEFLTVERHLLVFTPFSEYWAEGQLSYQQLLNG